MKPRACLLLILFISAGLSACNSPPLYEKHAREYLLAKGEKPELVQQLERLQAIDAQTLNRLAIHNNVAVLHLVASNPGASVKLLKTLAGHLSQAVRNGVARNPKAPVDLLLSLRTKGRYTTTNLSGYESASTCRDTGRDVSQKRGVQIQLCHQPQHPGADDAGHCPVRQRPGSRLAGHESQLAQGTV